MRRRRLVIGAVLLLALATLAGGTARRLASRRLRDDLDRARKDIEAGYIALAHARLSELGRRWPGRATHATRPGAADGNISSA
jgi:hypothetical protein